jgi:hypothetical protein
LSERMARLIGRGNRLQVPPLRYGRDDKSKVGGFP